MDATHLDRLWFRLAYTLGDPPTHGDPPGPAGSGGFRQWRWLALGVTGAVLLAASAVAPLNARQEGAIIRHQAEQGDVRAEMLLGLRYHEGRGVAQDDAQARQWLERAAQGGDDFAADQLGRFYAEGTGVPADPATAVSWWRQAAAGGVSDAQRRLGMAYLQGNGTAQDDAEARHWLGAAAAQGDDDARNGLTEMVREGRADPALLDRDAGAFDRFARESHSKVMHFFAAVGDLLRGGLPALTPTGSALRQRAEQGDVVAQYQLAWRYRTGAWGEPQDDAKALHWFRQAANHGNHLAMQSLAEIYEQGLLGTRPDPSAAAHWRRQAEAQPTN